MTQYTIEYDKAELKDVKNEIIETLANEKISSDDKIQYIKDLIYSIDKDAKDVKKRLFRNIFKNTR